MKKILCLFLVTIILVGCTSQEEELRKENKKVQNTNQITQEKNKTEKISTPKPEKSKKKNVWNKKKIISEKKELGTCYAYPSKDGKECWLIKYKLDKNANIETVKFPSTIQGMKVTKIAPKSRSSYQVTIFGIVIYDNGDELLGTKKTQRLGEVKELVFSDNIEIIGEDCLEGFVNLERIILPKSLKQIVPPYAGYCRNLQYIELPAENKNFIMRDGMLIKKKNNRILFMLTQKEEVCIPNDVKVLKYMYMRKGIKTLQIHAGVEEIDCGIIIDDPVLMIVDKENPNYVSKDNCVYQKETGALTSVTITGETLYIAEGVERINPFLTNYCEFGKSEKVKKLFILKV